MTVTLKKVQTLAERYSRREKQNTAKCIYCKITIWRHNCGVSFWGEKSTERLMSKGESQMCVEVDFVNKDGELFNLIRRKNGSTTTVTLNGHQMTQTNLVNIFAEKDIFLSLVNPIYFIEKIASDGRELLQKLLPPISQEEILSKLSEQSRDLLEPEYYIKNKRDELKATDEQEMYLSGQLALLEEQLEANSVTKNKLETNIKTLKAKIASVMEKQFAGIDVENIKQQYNASKKSSSNDEILALEKKRMEIQNKQYVSKFAGEGNKTEAELKAVHSEYNRLYKKATGIRPGVPCPTCTHSLTDAEFNTVKKEIIQELNNLKAKGVKLKSQLDDIVKLDTKAKEQFLQYQADDLKKVEEEIKAVKSSTTADIDKLRDILTYGNFSEEQVNKLEAMKAELYSDETDLRAMRSDDELQKTIESVKLQIKDNDVSRQFIKYLIAAANEYAVKRAEIMLTPLKMKQASIKLFEVVKSTGELKGTFKFTYDGKDYRWLSTSERIKAGLEVANLLKRLTGLAYPTFIDNAESINTNFMRPYGQTIFAFVKKCALTIQEPAYTSKEAA